MHKIADADELEHELRRLLAHAQTEAPSRTRMATALLGLSERVAETRLAAIGAPLLDAKITWALELADIMAARFSSAGGWRDHHIKTSIHRTQSGCALHLASELGWDCSIDITVEGAGQIEIHFTVPNPNQKTPRTDQDGLPDLNDLDLSDLFGRKIQETFPIRDREPMAKMMMAVSLWISKQLPRP